MTEHTNITTIQEVGSLEFDPFTITHQMNPNSFCLELPTTTCIYSIFHVSLLEAYYESKIHDIIL